MPMFCLLKIWNAFSENKFVNKISAFIKFKTWSQKPTHFTLAIFSSTHSTSSHTVSTGSTVILPSHPCLCLAPGHLPLTKTVYMLPSLHACYMSFSFFQTVQCTLLMLQHMVPLAGRHKWSKLDNMYEWEEQHRPASIGRV